MTKQKLQITTRRDVIRRKATEQDAEPREGGVQSVDRALHIIETLAEDDEGYRLRRFVQFDRSQSKWHVGAQSFAVGATFTRRRNFVAQALPYLRKLRDLTRETANLAMVDDESIIVLTRMESREIGVYGVDHVAVAEGLGCKAIRVTDPHDAQAAFATARWR